MSIFRAAALPHARSVMQTVLALSTVLVLSVAAHAQETTAFKKSYPVSGQPTLTFAVSDSSLTFHSCGECRQVHVKVILKNRKLSDFVLDEGQSGDSVRFSLKEKPHMGFHVEWRTDSNSRVEVEVPATVALDARTDDGGLTVSGLSGDLTLRTSDGGQKLDHLAGTLKLQTSDGHIQLRDSSGTLEARASDGGMDVSGSFTALQLHSSDGSIKADLSQSANLNAISRVESSDGGVTLLLPKSFAAEFDIKTRDGGVSSNLPLTLDGYNSKGDSGHAIHGKMNGGGALLTIRTDDGGVKLNAAS